MAPLSVTVSVEVVGTGRRWPHQHAPQLVAQPREQKVPKQQRIESHNDPVFIKIFPFYKDNTMILNLNNNINFFLEMLDLSYKTNDMIQS